MGFWKKIAENIVRSAGYNVPTEMTMAQARRRGTGFAGLLMNPQQNGMQIPNPPKPPADLEDVEAQRRYNQDLLDYNQRFRAYHTQVMTMMMQRFNMMQQAILQTRQQAGNSQGVSSPLAGNPGVGGILGGDTDV